MVSHSEGLVEVSLTTSIGRKNLLSLLIGVVIFSFAGFGIGATLVLYGMGGKERGYVNQRECVLFDEEAAAAYGDPDPRFPESSEFCLQYDHIPVNTVKVVIEWGKLLGIIGAVVGWMIVWVVLSKIQRKVRVGKAVSQSTAANQSTILREGIYRLNSHGETVFGEVLNAYVASGDFFYCVEVKIFADGLVDCWGLITLDQFTEKLKKGEVTTSLPVGASVYFDPLNYLTFHGQEDDQVKEEEFLKEVKDVLDRLNGRLDSLARCRFAFERYQAKPNTAHRHELKVAYQSVPEHNRRYVLGDMDQQDYPIRAVLDDTTEAYDG